MSPAQVLVTLLVLASLGTVVLTALVVWLLAYAFRCRECGTRLTRDHSFCPKCVDRTAAEDASRTSDSARIEVLARAILSLPPDDRERVRREVWGHSTVRNDSP